MKASKVKYIIFFLILSLAFASLWGCGNPSLQSHTTQIYALDTVIDVTAYGENAAKATDAAQQEIYRLEKLFSVTNEDSEISELNNALDSSVSLSIETYDLLKKAKDLNATTDGNFDVTVYPIIKLWGFTEKNYRVPSEAEISTKLQSVNSNNIILRENNSANLTNNAQVDLGGIAKGYIADKAAKAMKDAGCTQGLISLGGNIRTIGTKPSGEPWSIGIKDPESQGYFATIETDECSVITSGAYQRNFTQDGTTYHHIIDPKTGKPSSSDAVSVTIIGEDGALCDALSTAVFIGGSEYAETLHSKTPDFEYIILTKYNELIASKNLESKLTVSKDHPEIKVIFR